MEVLDNQQQVVESNSDEGGGAATTPPPAAQPAVVEKSPLDKLKEKAAGGIAPAAKTAAEQAADAAKIVEAWKPNLKFKAAGKELDVPQMFHGLMKDQESEKYLHSLLSKAHGIEMIQEKLKGAREARDQAHTAYQTVMKPISQAREAYGRGDLDFVFQTLRMDPNKVLQWAYNKVQLSQMPADQRQVHEARAQAERRNWELEQQAKEQQEAGHQTQSTQINEMMDIVLERPDLSAIAQAYDARKNKEGAFRELAFKMGEMEFAESGKVISPLEAAKRAVDLLGETLGKKEAAQQAPQATAPAPAQTAQPAATEKKPIVLPNAGGSKTAAPAKSKVKSIDDLRKIHQQMATS